MNIKSLLLGSAAALVAVSGAQAADAIIAAEPEPLEYVRVCDAFGTGFFYIPGTETCLRIHGYVRHDILGGDLLGLDTDGDGDGDAYAKNSRLSLRTSTATDTELGTLRTYTETRFNYNNNTGNQTPSLNFAWIELGGLRVGKDESVFTTWTGYAGSVIRDDTAFGYGPFDTQLISYTYDAGNGFSAILSLEDDGPRHQFDDYTAVYEDDEGYMPDVVAGAKYEAGAFGLSVVGAYDESMSEGAVKARLDGSFGGFSAFVMGGWSSNGDEFTTTGSNRFAAWGGDWAVWGGVSAPITDRVTFNSQIQYDDYENFGAIGNLVFNVVDGFAVTTEVIYVDNLDDNDLLDNDGEWGGVLRFQRSF
ncbi:porin [Pararhizobium haloflavum]|uniref:porin n=1 Tax=Pararhizobium haloflavum TaxID=2037914 RepID=UPI000C18A736|nr:porin [Pararhizobium haloflavum]